MNRTKIKNYAPQARRDFLQAVTDRAAFYGLTADRIEPVTAQGDVAIIGGRAFPREIGAKRKALQERVERDGFGPTMEALAYTWFNRLVAIRYMELHGYLEHGYRVLSNPDPAKSTPEILDQAEHVELPDLRQERVVELKLDGAKEAELYRMLLVAQCNALHSAMPFLFERIGDETELVLPEGLLHSDSIVRKLVSGIDEEDWREVEVIGWLYQFYISDKKADVIGKVVKSEDLPAATQLFTPNWIVKYMIQNSLGRQWVATYPNSPLKAQMEFYIEPAEQTPEVHEQLRAITPTSLDPEEITFLDPACGSAHVLVEAYDLFKAIYQERGYRAKDIPRLILSKNLFGLEIDNRAAQLAAFALMMKARADDRRIFDQAIQPQVRALVQTDGMDAEDVAAALNASDSKETPPSGRLFETDDNLFTRAASTAVRPQYTSLTDVMALVDLFQHAKSFGSLIQVPLALAARLPQIEKKCRKVAGQTSEIISRTATMFLPIVEQARMVAGRYDCVVANPPYMGGKYMNATLKGYMQKYYPSHKSDLFAAFAARILCYCKDEGYVGLMTPFTWMFIKSYEPLRKLILGESFLTSLVRPEYHAFFESAYVPICTFTLFKHHIEAAGEFFDLADFYGEEVQPTRLLEAIRSSTCGWRFSAAPSSFRNMPGSPLAYWASKRIREAFSSGIPLERLAPAKHGMSTGNNERFIRFWWEVSWSKVMLDANSHQQAEMSGRKWFPYCKGGEYRKWYGNNFYVLNYERRGRDMRLANEEGSNPGFRHDNQEWYYKNFITYTNISSSDFGARYQAGGAIFDQKGCAIVASEEDDLLLVLGFLHSNTAKEFLRILCPTMDFNVGSIFNVPLIHDKALQAQVGEKVKAAIDIARADWDASEISWGYTSHPMISLGIECSFLQESWNAWKTQRSAWAEGMRGIETSINRSFIDAYRLQGELQPDVSDSQITLASTDQPEDIKRLISYAVGCTMGRYSLDTPGLVYAHGGDVGFDPGQYTTFPADPDGIVPVMEADWFADDAANRFIEFLGVAWPMEGLDENLKFVADALGPNKGEQPLDTIRRYLATGFFKHHLQTYKRRPIYWLFSSGKQRAFQCLVYLHRYHDGTLARMRTEYVIPLQGKLASRIDQLAGDIPKATSTSHRTTLTKERDKLIKQQAELQAYDEKLRHYADMRITLDLDDGVKVNYGKFGDLLAEVKAVTGGREDD